MSKQAAARCLNQQQLQVLQPHAQWSQKTQII